MFARAGFNPRRRRVFYALVSRRGARWRRPAALVEFRSGDWVWEGAGERFTWPEDIYICSLIAVQGLWDLPESAWPRDDADAP